MKVWLDLFLWDILKNYLFVLSDSAVYLPFSIGLYLWDPSGIYAALVFPMPCALSGLDWLCAVLLFSLQGSKRLKKILMAQKHWVLSVRLFLIG